MPRCKALEILRSEAYTGCTPQRLALLDVYRLCSSCFVEANMFSLHLRVWRTLSNRVKMRATPQMGVFQHPCKTKAWHPKFECQAFELPTTHLPLRWIML
jgi:hypothetical protein